jgi:phosphoglycerol transferase MdoB-like AlkP superfamily enzyme
MSVFRAVFFFYYGKSVDLTGFGFDIIKSFYMGIRFDAAVLGYINAPITLSLIILFFVGRPAYFQKLFTWAKRYYVVVVGSAFIFLCIDFGFYSYFQDHLNILAYGIIDDDTKALLSTMNENYNLPLIFAGFAFIYVLIYLISKKILKTPPQPQTFPKNIPLKISVFILLGLLNFLIIRGTFHMFPLSLFHSEISTNTFLNKTAINGFYTMQDALIIRSEESKEIDFISKAGYGTNIRQAFADFLGVDISDIPQTNPENSLIVNLAYNKEIETIRPNVILIVMESFGSDLIKYNSDDFNVLGELKKHFDQDIVFLNFLAGHHVTIGSLEATITNVARKPMSPYLSQSKFVYNRYAFAGPKPYKDKDYKTFFIYGGNMGWRGLEPFMLSLGFDEVLGEGAMDSKLPRNQWGIFDGYLFDFVFETLQKSDQPKFIQVLTMTNHPPFSLPKDYKKLPLNPPEILKKRIQDKELAQMRFETYQYANQVLGEFITKIKNSKYADNTIIAVTGDHNFWGLFQYQSQDLLDKLSVPFYLYIPKKLRPRTLDTKVFGSHLDIMPTLYHLSLSKINYMAMGQNLLSKKAKTNIASHDSGAIMDERSVVQYDFQTGNAQYFIWDKNNPRHTLTVKENAEHKKLIKHFLSQTAVSDFLIKQTGAQLQNKGETK